MLVHQYALDKALKKAKGERLKDDTFKLKKTKKFLDKTKSKHREKWNDRKREIAATERENQEKRRANIQKKSSQGSKSRSQ